MSPESGQGERGVESYPRIATFKSADSFRTHLNTLRVELPCDDSILKAPASPLAKSITYNDFTIGNRWAIHPMEGWDGTLDGKPSELTTRRWQHFGISGAKLIWGGEAVAVRHDGRANPNQLLINDQNLSALESLLNDLKKAHLEKTGATADLYVGLQLTHSGRFCRPNRKDLPEPLIAYHHPILDQRVGAALLLSDDDLSRLVEDFVRAAEQAYRIGFHFVDVKHCHGYLAHELLSAKTRPGRYGGSFENRTRFLSEVVSGIRATTPNLHIGVRVSLFDLIPYVRGSGRGDLARTNVVCTGEVSSPLGTMGIPESFEGRYEYGFGVNPENPSQYDLSEGLQFIELLLKLGIRLVNVTAGSPYYVPHIQRPALFPPSDGYSPPEDPLIGVQRLLNAAQVVKRKFPEAIVVGTGFTYLQEYLPHVAQAVVREGWMDFAGLGRMVLAYPELPFDCLTKGSLDRRRICRTFSDCTTGPRKGLVSGCYPLDPFYKESEMGNQLKRLK